MIIHGYFGQQLFTISQLSILPPRAPGDDPLVNFLLSTPYGKANVEEPVHDGHLPRCDGCWVDRLDWDMPEESREELLNEGNAVLKRVVWGTRLSHLAVYAKANLVGVTLRFDDSQPLNVWEIVQEDENEVRVASLHQVEFHLDRMSKE